MLLIVLLVLLAVSIGVGGFGQSRRWGYAGWSPAGLILIVLVVMLVTGHARF